MSSVIRISSPNFGSHSKRVVMDHIVEAWIEESDGEPGRWVDISSAVRAVYPILEHGSIARANIDFFIAGLDTAAMVPTDDGVENLRAFVEKSGEKIDQLRSFLAQIDAERAA